MKKIVTISMAVLFVAFSLNAFAISKLSRSLPNANQHVLAQTARVAYGDKYAKVVGLSQEVTVMNDSDDPKPIQYAPEGTVVDYYEHIWGFNALNYAQGAIPNEIVWCDNGEVYIKNPIASYATECYMKGFVDGNKIKVSLPQCIGVIDLSFMGRPIQYLFANKMELYDDPNHGSWYRAVADEKNYVEYDIDENGNVSLALGVDPSDEFPAYILGMTSSLTEEEISQGIDPWVFFGDAIEEFSVFDNSTITLPDGVEPEQWQAVYINSDSSQRSISINVAIVNDDIYVGNLYEGLPDSYVKGTIDGDKVVFPSYQFLGEINPYTPFMVFFCGAKWGKVSDPYYGEIDGYVLINDFVMNYDADKKRLVAEEGYTALINTSKDYVYFFDVMSEATFQYFSEEDRNAAPQNPVFVNFFPMDPNDEYAYGSQVVWQLPTININGAPLDPSKMYYIFYVDGEPFTFYTDEYSGLTENITEVPFEFTDGWDITRWDSRLYIYIFFTGAETLGLQTYYNGSDGETYSSDVVTVSIGEDKVGSNYVDQSPVASCYISLSGQSIVSPSNGVYIRVDEYADGSKRYTKTFVK